MSVLQLTLWDNQSLEEGYCCLNTLAFSEATGHFKDGMDSGIAEPSLVQKLIAVCEYWQTRIRYSTSSAGNSTEKIKALLADYVHYAFSPQMNNFKNAVLAHIVSLLLKESKPDLHDLGTTFDFLIEAGEFQKAEELVTNLSTDPGNPLLKYMLAQAQWLNLNRAVANNNYVWALLCFPQKTIPDRIENKKLRDLVIEYGAAFAPAYGWLRNVVPYIYLPDKIEVYDEEHRKALQCYCLLRDATKAWENNDQKTTLQYRRELQKLMPSLYAEYFNWLQVIK